MAPDAAMALRLGLAPVLALVWTIQAGEPLPFLAPVLAVTLLLGPTRPPLVRLALVVVLVAIVTLGIVGLARATADAPLSFWLGLVALAAFCFARLAAQPRDLAASLALIVASLVTTLTQVSSDLPGLLPVLMTRATLQAVVVTLLAHSLLQSRIFGMPVPVPTAAAPMVRVGLVVIGKALGLVAALATAVLFEDTSAILIAVTVTNVLREPDSAASRAFGWAVVTGNLWAATLAAPVLALVMLRPEPLVLLPAACAAALWLADGVRRGGAVTLRMQVALPAYILLLGLLGPKAGEGAATALADRLFTLTGAVVYALAVLATLPRTSATSRPAP